MIRLIAALDDRNGIARTGHTVWDIPDDLKHFRNLTLQYGAVILMGRKTYETIGRALPYRRNLVASKSDQEFGGCETVKDLEYLLQNTNEDIWVIGGGEIYQAAMPYADELYLTHVKGDYKCDVFFPDYTKFTPISESEPKLQNNFEYKHSVYTKK